MISEREQQNRTEALFRASTKSAEGDTVRDILKVAEKYLEFLRGSKAKDEG